MKHYIYRIQGGCPDPIGAGDSRSWFFYYKWPEDSLVFLPDPRMGAHDANAGDRLWVVIDDEIIGTVPIHEVIVENESMRHVSQELWYDASQKQVIKQNVSELFGGFACGVVYGMKNLGVQRLNQVEVEKLVPLLVKST